MSRFRHLTVSKNTGSKHTATVIFLHGSGGNGENMREWVFLMTKNFTFPHIKIIYPTAPLQPYTPSGGLLSNVWFDRIAVNQDVPEKYDSVKHMEEHIRNMISIENEAGIPTNRIVVGGFSMGGALSLYTGYKWEKDLAGVFIFSSFLNNNSVVYQELMNTQAKKLPQLLQIHGARDDLVPLAWAQKTFINLSSLGVNGELHVIERLGHSLSKIGMNSIKQWIDRVLPEV